MRKFFAILPWISLFFLSHAQPSGGMVDEYGRTLILHGLNTSGSAKHIDGHQPWIAESDVARE